MAQLVVRGYCRQVVELFITLRNCLYECHGG